MENKSIFSIGDIIKYEQGKKIGVEKIEAIEFSKGDVIYITTLGTRVLESEVI